MNWITQIDGELLIKLQQLVVCDQLTPIAKFLTHIGDKGMIWIAFIIAMLIFKKSRKAGVMSGVALALSFALNNMLLKPLIHRTRPYDVFDAVQLLIERQSDFSFPSGHAANSMVVGTMMLLMLPKGSGVPAFILAILISLSRLYVGVHYPTDVLCGMLSGTLCAYIVYRIFKRGRCELLGCE